ncbi:MAG: DUF2157 domain-containing protein [Melioribacteraceae bacterium]|nr:DUF2157 domain-containing protein [Melioribacteraceae bacterium]MCF8264813.1 DUF2157 domain-containing protein [Melioribacteraceae bacterium]MCF8414408.1 DUF2157 domain-containing protein [Melioribacteraceae bacterium]MCF8430356.1 DUF2157 domain-containing protein [Melioribacteraceae bacterium]
MDKDQIDKWLAEGTITTQQAEVMLKDTTITIKEKSSNKFLTTISVLGALFIGNGILWMVASNWDWTPDIVKLLILFVSTSGTLMLGYYLGYTGKDYPKIGNALIFLSTILYCISVVLIAQIYNVNTGEDWLTLLCFLGVLPVVYLFQAPIVAVFSNLLLWSWAMSLLLKNISEDNIVDAMFISQVFGLFLFGIGSIHYIWEKFAKVARSYRLFGIIITIITLFSYTFRFTLETIHDGVDSEINLLILIPVYLVISLMLIFNLLKNPSKSETNKIEAWTTIIVFNAFTFFSFLLYNEAAVLMFWVIFNLTFVGIVMVLFKTGYNRMDMRLINIASISTFSFLVVKFFDIFSNLLESGITWLLFGLLLIGGAVLLEKKRKQIRKNFDNARLEGGNNG